MLHTELSTDFVDNKINYPSGIKYKNHFFSISYANITACRANWLIINLKSYSQLNLKDILCDFIPVKTTQTPPAIVWQSRARCWGSHGVFEWPPWPREATAPHRVAEGLL
jgi:hypothetical protein